MGGGQCRRVLNAPHQAGSTHEGWGVCAHIFPKPCEPEGRNTRAQSLQALLNGALATFPQQALLQQNSVDLKVNAEQLKASPFIVTVQGQVKASLVERVKSNFTPFSDAWRAAAGLMVPTQPEPFRNVPEDVLKNIDDKVNAASSLDRNLFTLTYFVVTLCLISRLLYISSYLTLLHFTSPYFTLLCVT